MKRLVLTSFICLSGLFAASSPRADVIPIDVAACNGKQVGSTCGPPDAGVCQSAMCSSLDYSHWDRDSSAGPPSMTYSCVKCAIETSPTTATNTATTPPSDGGPTSQTGTATSTTTVTGTTTSAPTATWTNTDTTAPTAANTATNTAPPWVTGTGTDTATQSPTATQTTTGTRSPTATAAATSTSTGTGSDEPPAKKDGWCAIAGHGAARRAAPWLLAGAFSLLFLLGRRRKQG